MIGYDFQYDFVALKLSWFNQSDIKLITSLR